MPYADYTLDPLGLSRPLLFDGTPNKNGFYDLLNPYSGAPFQCAGGQPTAVDADGSQVAGTNCNMIPITGGPTGYGLADPIGLAMMGLYPASSTPNSSTLHELRQRTGARPERRERHY